MHLRLRLSEMVVHDMVVALMLMVLKAHASPPLLSEMSASAATAVCTEIAAATAAGTDTASAATAVESD